jgi:hypothetical protein
MFVGLKRQSNHACSWLWRWTDFSIKMRAAIVYLVIFPISSASAQKLHFQIFMNGTPALKTCTLCVLGFWSFVNRLWWK